MVHRTRAGRRVLAFLTDADLPAARIAHAMVGLTERTATTREVGAILAEAEFIANDGGFTAAHGSVLEPYGSANWLAAGDAGMGFDPLSSRGLLHALFTGLAAAEAVDSCLGGDDEAVPRYCRLMYSIQQTCRRRLNYCYASETRRRSSPFWRRRQGKH